MYLVTDSNQLLQFANGGLRYVMVANTKSDALLHSMYYCHSLL